MWKNYGKPSKKPHQNKEEQWKAIRQQMKNGNAAATTNATSAADTKVKKADK